MRFQVLSEGERGLLGVGYAPARVVAVADEAPSPRSGTRATGRAGARARRADDADGIGVRCRIDVREDEDDDRASCCGGASSAS